MTHVILVVEDNERNLKLLCDLLEYEGYDVRVARTGEDAVATRNPFGDSTASSRRTFCARSSTTSTSGSGFTQSRPPHLRGICEPDRGMHGH